MGSDLYRLCIGYRALNKLTKKISFALPAIQDILDSLNDKRFFISLDMRSGYFCISISPKTWHVAAYQVTGSAKVQPTVLPFGLANSSAVYLRLMNRTLEGLLYKSCYSFADDVLIGYKTAEEHVKDLELVLDRLQQANIKIHPGKCKNQ